MPYKNPQKRIESDRNYRKKNRLKINAVILSWAKRNPERSRNIKLRYRFGVDFNYDETLKKQNGVCGVCLNPLLFPVVDHSHKTGKVRGIICRRHNTGLGIFNDSIASLTLAIEYLKKNGE